jgi:hypothetical protein
MGLHPEWSRRFGEQRVTSGDAEKRVSGGDAARGGARTCAGYEGDVLGAPMVLNANAVAGNNIKAGNTLSHIMYSPFIALPSSAPIATCNFSGRKWQNK